MPTSDNKREMKKINIYFAHAAGKSSGKANSVYVTFEQAMANLEVLLAQMCGGGWHWEDKTTERKSEMSLLWVSGQCDAEYRSSLRGHLF